MLLARVTVLALKKDGTICRLGLERLWSGDGAGGAIWGSGRLPPVTGHSLALKNDGTVVAWGRTAFGQATVPAGLSAVGAIAAGWEHSLALKHDGTVVAWGWNYSGQARVPPGCAGWPRSPLDGHSLALKNDGSVVAWG